MLTAKQEIALFLFTFTTFPAAGYLAAVMEIASWK